eukprot:CAMPEP_0178505548 /NCGR_PEP_ID=MMETSP0696-20121128/19189_1 /TAXON_ID=265572 /ORGANISM="Extubocellulus spinifer, Strain CCMP396" /LENGTH=68 /DNA_ID=CAMNT_0020134865 /DNA_START=266 /DNA_END=472 /DNA_ORIENTATION=-
MGNEQSSPSPSDARVDVSNVTADPKSARAKNECSKMPGSKDETVSSHESGPSTPTRRSTLTWEKPRPL